MQTSGPDRKGKGHHWRKPGGGGEEGGRTWGLWARGDSSTLGTSGAAPSWDGRCWAGQPEKLSMLSQTKRKKEDPAQLWKRNLS